MENLNNEGDDIIPYRIEDGKGSRNRTQIFQHRLRTLATSVSLINHFSQEPTEGEAVIPTTGVFDARVLSEVAGSGASLMYLVNNSPDNFIVIDRVYTNEIICATPTPDTSTYVSIIMGSAITPGTGTLITTINTNRAIGFIQPDITLLNGAITSGGVESERRYINPARVYGQEMLPQKEDGIILGKGNSIEFFLNTLSSTTISTDMRFAVVTMEDTFTGM
jgi:hypothetical protein